jgi:hypothetical protein
MLRVCVWHVASSRICNIRCFGKVPRGARALFLPRLVALAGGGGVRARRPNFRSAHREEWVWRISSRESSAPHRMKPSPTALKPLLDALLEGRSSDPVMMSIATRLGSWSGFHGGATTTAPNTAGPVLSGSSAGQVGSARIPAYTSPLQCFLREKFLRCW